MATFKSLAKRLDKFNEKLPEKVNKVAKQTALDVLNVVTSSGVTKVDTSEAVSNWRIGLGSKDPTTRPPFFKGKGGSTAAASRAEVRTVGKIKISNKKTGQEIHISNNVDHIDVAFPEKVDRVLAPVRQMLKQRVERLEL